MWNNEQTDRFRELLLGSKLFGIYLMLVIEILHDFVYQNIPNPRNCGSIVYIG